MSENGLLTPELSKRLQAMVGFRNIAVHDYQSVNLVILQRIIETLCVRIVVVQEPEIYI